MRYSPLAEISRENVSRLKVAWVFHTGDISDGSHDRKRSGFETTPIVVDGTLYLTTHGSDGIWTFDLASQATPAQVASTPGLGFVGILFE